MQNLDPQTLAQILSLQNSQRAVDNGASAYWYDPRFKTDDPNGWILNKVYGYDFAQGDGGENARNASKDQTYIRKVRPDTGGNLGDYWDTSGNYLGTYDALNGGGGEFNKAAALMAAGYFGGNALANAYGGAAAGGMSASQQAAMMAANGMTDAEIAAALGTQGAQSAGLAGIGGGATTAATGMAPTAGASASSGSAYDSALKAGSTGGSLFGDAAKSIGGNGQLLGAGLGAVAGALDGKDKTQSSTRDPWAEAQPFLKQLLAQGSQLATQYQNQPFSQAQKTAYGNVGGLLDLTNANAQGLMSAFNQIGNNKFVRGQRNTGGATTGLLSGFAPGSYGSFGI